jgi:hypothetical protein
MPQIYQKSLESINHKDSAHHRILMDDLDQDDSSLKPQ